MVLEPHKDFFLGSPYSNMTCCDTVSLGHLKDISVWFISVVKMSRDACQEFKTQKKSVGQTGLT